MEHRLRRKQLNSDTDASNETYFEKKEETHFQEKESGKMKKEK